MNAVFERCAWEIAQETSVARKNLKATEAINLLGVPRKERKQTREKLLSRADEIAALRYQRKVAAKEKTTKTYNDLLRIAEEKILANPQDVVGDGYLALESRRLAQHLRKTDTYEFLLRIVRKEIQKRGIGGVGYIALPYKVYDYDCNNHAWLVGDEGYQEYTRNLGYYREAKWLFGRDDAGYWAVRVPASCKTAREAIEWLKPAPVKRAEEEGRWVARQGDTYFVELKAGRDNLDELPRSHKYDPETRTFTHDRHAPVTVPGNVKAVRVYRQTQLRAEGGRVAAD